MRVIYKFKVCSTSWRPSLQKKI